MTMLKISKSNYWELALKYIDKALILDMHDLDLNQNSCMHLVVFKIIQWYRPIPFKKWLNILVSHFYLLWDERKGRDSACVKWWKKGKAGFWSKRNRSIMKYQLVFGCIWEYLELFCSIRSLYLVVSWSIWYNFLGVSDTHSISFKFLASGGSLKYHFWGHKFEKFAKEIFFFPIRSKCFGHRFNSIGISKS